MKKWVYVSVSLLAGMAAGTAKAASRASSPSSTTAMSAEDAAKCLKQLDLDKAPSLREPSPCYSSTK